VVEHAVDGNQPQVEQAAQLVAPVVALNVPEAQAAHFPPLLKVPALHVAHTRSVVAVPAVLSPWPAPQVFHAWQEVELSAVE